MFSSATKSAPGIPLPAMVASVWGGFLFEGLFAVGAEGGPQRMSKVLEAWDQGCIELVIGASVLLPALWREVSAAWESGEAEFPGVLEYEVVSALGSWLGDRIMSTGTMPEADAVLAEIRQLVGEFFRQGQGAAG